MKALAVLGTGMTEQLLCVPVSTAWPCTPSTACILPSPTAEAEGSSAGSLGRVTSLSVNGGVPAHSLWAAWATQSEMLIITVKAVIEVIVFPVQSLFIDSFSKISQQLLGWCGCVTCVGSCTPRAKTSSASPLQVPVWGAVGNSDVCRVQLVQAADWFGLIFLEEVCGARCGRADKRGEVCQAGTTPVQSDISGVKTPHCLCHLNPWGFCSLPLLPFSSWRKDIPAFSIFYFHLLSWDFSFGTRPNLVLKVSVSLYFHLIWCWIRHWIQPLS